jgi:Apea-like HEPN
LAVVQAIKVFHALWLQPASHASVTQANMPLDSNFLAACRTCLPKLFQTWLSVNPVDLRRIVRPAEHNSFSISIESYRGAQTWIQFHRLLENLDSYGRLSRAIAEHQPELSQHLVLPGMVISLANPVALVSTWCRFLEDRNPDGCRMEESIEELLVMLSEVLETRTLTESIVTALAGVKLSSSESCIKIAPGALLRSLTPEELADLGAEDITLGHGHDLISHSVSSCFELQRTCRFNLEPAHPQTPVIPTEPAANGVSATSVLRGLHVLKGGRAGVFLTKTERNPKVLPYLGGGSSWPSQRPTFAGLILETQEVEIFTSIERALRETTRDELRIAADRLVDAENRLSKVDALLDSVIGLEILLNPMDSSELAFRVALNYAFLGPPEHRRERYDRVRAIQKTRNRVVHGGLNSQSPDSSTLHEHAELAIAILRDSLKSFLLDAALSGNQKLDANFWLDRLFPAIVAGEMRKPDRGASGNGG